MGTVLKFPRDWRLDLEWTPCRDTCLEFCLYRDSLLVMQHLHSTPLPLRGPETYVGSNGFVDGEFVHYRDANEGFETLTKALFDRADELDRQRRYG